MCFEVVLPRRARQQPSPSIYPAGDCGPCCLAGALDLSVQEVYDRIVVPTEEKVTALSHPSMRSCMYCAEREGLVSHFVTETPIWPDHYRLTYGMPAWQSCLEWFDYVVMALNGGYYGLCAMSFNYGGPFSDTDHWVMLCGAKEYTTPNKHVEGAKDVQMEVLISCSASNPSGYWKSCGEFLSKAGGYDVILMKPAKA